jgi:hypothetical protein
VINKIQKYINSGLLILLLFLISCGVPKSIRKRMTYCYNGLDTGLDTLININGYYNLTYIWERDERYTTKGQWVHKIDTMHSNIMFYNDGMFASGLWGRDLNNRNYINRDIQYYFNVLEESENITIGASYRGSYKISGDTIKTQYINHSSALTNVWMAFETWYKVIDKNTIKIIARKKLYYDRMNQDKSEMDLHLLDNNDQKTLSFFPIQTRLDSDCWLKKKKWFWCNGEKIE